KAFRVFNSRTRIVQETLHVNFMENKLNVAGSAWLFDIDSLTRTMNYHPVILENQTNSHNNNKDALVNGKEHDDDIQKSVSPDIHSSSSGAQTRKQGDKTENKDKGKSPVVTITRFKDLNAEFKECTNNSTNRVNAASTLVSTAGHNFINNTNDFSAAGPSNAATSPTAANSSSQDASTSTHDPDMLNLEDLTHSDDADDIGFEDPENPDKVYKVVKALYGLRQAPRAWYETLATYLLENGFQRGKIDQTLFIKKQQKDILLVQIYVDDIVFEKPLLKDSDGKDVDVHTYRSMIGSLMYLTSSRSDIMFPVCACARFQVTPKVSHLNAVKRIFIYLKGKPYLGLWYPKDSPFDLVAYSDSDYASASLDKKSTTGGCQFLRRRLISWQCKKQTVVATSLTEAEYVDDYASCYLRNMVIEIVVLNILSDALPITTNDDVTRLQGLVDMKKIVISEDVIREILQLDDAEGVVCLPNEAIFASLAQMGYEKPSTKLTFYKAFFSSQWKFLIHTLLQSLSAKRTSWNEFSTAMASAIICLSKVGDLSTHTTRFNSLALTQKVFENMRWVRKGFLGVETPLFEGMIAARQLAEEGIAEEQVQADDAHDKAAQDLEIIKLKARVKRLERANKGRMIDDLDKDEGIELVVDQVKDADIVETEGRHAAEQAKKQAEIYHLDLDHPSKFLNVVTIASQISAASATISATTPSIPAAAPTVVAAYTRRRKGVIIRDLEEELSLKTPAETPKLKDKGKCILVETPKPMKKKNQIELDAEYAKKLHEEINKDYKEINKDYKEINKDIDWDVSIDHVKQKSKNPQYIKRYQVMKKRPRTESEARKNMMIYLKNTAAYKMDFFKGISYDGICPIFQARFDANMRFLFKSKEEMEEEDQEVLKSINETPAQKAAKRRKLNEEAQEAE
nr:hypothetical protein [Tanacetum cinerariifolium]